MIRVEPTAKDWKNSLTFLERFFLNYFWGCFPTQPSLFLSPLPPPSVFISSNLFKRCSGPFGNTIACVFCRTSYWLDLWKVCSRSLGTGDRPTLPLPSLAISHPCQMRSIASLRHCCCCSTVQWGQPHSEQKHLLLFVGWRTRILVLSSVTRLVDLLDFGQLLKPLATIILPKSPTFLDNICKLVKIYHFLDKSFLGNFYRHLVIFYGHTGSLTHSSPSIKYCCNLVSAALTFLLQAVWPDLAKFDHFGKTLKDRQ